MSERISWVLLAYRIPREPSTPRIAVWRQIKRLGAAQLGDGLIALPQDARTREQLDWIADTVSEAGGEASVWLAEAASAGQEHVIARQLADARAQEYQAVIDEAGQEPHPTRRQVQRLRRELRRITRRDYFPPPQRALAKAAVEGLAAQLAASAPGPTRGAR